MSANPADDQEFGVQRLYPKAFAEREALPRPYGQVYVYETKAQAEYAADYFNPDTYRILVRDVSAWREVPFK